MLRFFSSLLENLFLRLVIAGLQGPIDTPATAPT